MTDLVFFYGTLMAGFDRRREADIDSSLEFIGRGWIDGALFDLGPYPAAIPASGSTVRGELYEILDPAALLSVLDEIEGCLPEAPGRSLYSRARAAVRLRDGTDRQAWVYFYNAPTVPGRRIDSGDYLEHLGRIGLHD